MARAWPAECGPRARPPAPSPWSRPRSGTGSTSLHSLWCPLASLHFSESLKVLAYPAARGLVLGGRRTAAYAGPFGGIAGFVARGAGEDAQRSPFRGKERHAGRHLVRSVPARGRRDHAARGVRPARSRLGVDRTRVVPV